MEIKKRQNISSNRPRSAGVHRALWRHNLRTIILPGGVTLLLVSVVLGWTQLYLPWRISQDLQGSEPRSTMGTVTDILVPTIRSSIDSMGERPNILVQVNGSILPARAHAPVQISQTVRVTYRLGSSGRTYIQRIDTSANGD